MKVHEVKGLDVKYRHDICGVSNKSIRRCRYLRYVRHNGELYLICAKGTAAGIKHSQRIDDILKENLDKKLSSMVVVAGDNCEGQAGEFVHLFEEDTN